MFLSRVCLIRAVDRMDSVVLRPHRRRYRYVEWPACEGMPAAGGTFRAADLEDVADIDVPSMGIIDEGVELSSLRTLSSLKPTFR